MADHQKMHRLTKQTSRDRTPRAASTSSERACHFKAVSTKSLTLAAAVSTYIAAALPASAQNTWGQAAKPVEKGFSWTDPIAPGFWMAWTNATAAFFVFIVLAIGTMGFLEWRRPGGAPRRGVLGLDTTRGDRLFVTLLGSAFLFLGWLGIMGTPLWGGLAMALVWGIGVFRWV